MLFYSLVIIILLIAVNGLYVAAEFAAVSARHSQIRQLAEQGNPLAAKLLPWIEYPRQLDQYVAACQIGITLSNLVLGAFVQATLGGELASGLQRWFLLQPVAAHSLSALTILFVITFVQVVCGELVPKTIALQFSAQTSLITFIPMRWSLKMFSLFIRGLNGAGLAIMRLFGIPCNTHRHIHSPEEIALLIAESRDGGLLEPDEHLRLSQALQLSSKTVRQLMVPRRYLWAIDVDTPTDQIVQAVNTSPYSHLPVYEESIDNVVGILHTKDVVLHLIEHERIDNIRDIMRPVMIVPESVTADTLVAAMRNQRTLQAIVVDEFGGTEGFITLEDVLSEMLGQVTDEFKNDKPRPERLADGRLRLPGLMRLDDAQPWLGALWQGEANTVSGHIIEVLGYFPEPGDTVLIEGISVQIEEVEHNTIKSLILLPPRSEDNDEGRSHG